LYCLPVSQGLDGERLPNLGGVRGIQTGEMPPIRQHTSIQVNPGRAGLFGIGVDRQEQVLVIKVARPRHV
jgi:hypothetical protein